jgi:hypothetical protein
MFTDLPWSKRAALVNSTVRSQRIRRSTLLPSINGCRNHRHGVHGDMGMHGGKIQTAAQVLEQQLQPSLSMNKIPFKFQ